MASKLYIRVKILFQSASILSHIENIERFFPKVFDDFYLRNQQVSIPRRKKRTSTIHRASEGETYEVEELSSLDKVPFVMS